MTPEGRVKAKVKKILAEYDGVWGWWPVPAGYGTNGLDYVGTCNGMFFMIETKAPGKLPTPLQDMVIRDARRAGATVFVIDDDKFPADVLRNWLDIHASRK